MMPSKTYTSPATLCTRYGFPPLLLLAIALLLCSCGGGAGGTEQPSAAESLVPSLPFPAAATIPARVVQAGGPYSFAQADVLYANNAAYTGTAFQLTPLPSAVLLFGVNVGTAAPSSVTVTGTLDQVYVGLADYAAQRWQWRGPYSSGQTLSLLDGRYLSPAGGLYIAVAAAAPGSGEVNVTVDTAPVDVGGHWNVLCWLAADNYLAPTAYAMLQDLEAAGSTSEITVLAGYDIDPQYISAPALGTDAVHYLKVVQDANPVYVNTTGDPANQSFPRAGFNSADPAKLAEFVDWAQDNFPAEHTALVLFGFGDGWRSQGAADEREPLDHAMSGLLADYADGGVRITADHDLAAALAGRHFDLLIADASSTSQLEALYEYRDVADWAVASQITVPAAGYPYANWLADWQAAFPLPAGAVGQRFIDAVDGRYGTQDLPWFINNLYNLQQLEALTGSLGQLMDDSETWPSILKPQIITAMSQTQSGGGRTSAGTLDLRLFLENLRGVAGVQEVKAHCNAALLALDRCAAYSRRSPTLAISGLSVFLPSASWFTPELQAEYAPLAFNQDTDWLNWLSGLTLPGSEIVRDWRRGWRLVVEYGEPGADAELEVFDPHDNYGRPTYTTELMGILELSSDNVASASAEEWATLLDGGDSGAYAFDVYYRDSTPAQLSLTAWLEDDAGMTVQDFGSFTVAAGKRVNIAALRLLDYGESDGYISPGDRLELSWTDPTLKCELRVRNPDLEFGGVTFPEGYAGTMVFGPPTSVSGSLAEWGRLAETAPMGAYQILAYVHDINTGMPAGGVASVRLMLFDSAGGVKHDFGTFTLRTSDAGSGTVIMKPLATLLYTE
jgi:hypothetical protein